MEAIDDGNSGKDERAEVAAFLSQILIDAAATANFDAGYINAAMKAASDQVETYLGGDGALMNEAAVSAMDSVMMSNYMKLSAEKVRKKYTVALTTLNASNTMITRLNDAVTTLSAKLIDLFKVFEAVWANEEAGLNKDGIDTAYNIINTDMDTAFNSFITNIAATKAEIDTMADLMYLNFGLAAEGVTEEAFQLMIDPDGSGAAADDNITTYGDGIFEFYDMSGSNKNWPIPMVAQVSWVADNYGNNFTYTRDNIPLPDAMWIANRTDFAGMQMPTGMAALMGLREDVEIIMARKWAGLSAASRDMTYAGYDTMSPADQAAVDVYEAAGNLTIFGKATLDKTIADDGVGDGTGAGDDLDGVTVTSFDALEDLAPYLIGAEVQGVEGLFIGRLIGRQDAINVAEGYSITAN